MNLLLSDGLETALIILIIAVAVLVLVFACVYIFFIRTANRVRKSFFNRGSTFEDYFDR